MGREHGNVTSKERCDEHNDPRPPHRLHSAIEQIHEVLDAVLQTSARRGITT
jgi:hypothetical protein